MSFYFSWLSKSKSISKKPFLERFCRISGFLVRLHTNLIMNLVSSFPSFLSMGFWRQFLMVEISGS